MPSTSRLSAACLALCAAILLPATHTLASKSTIDPPFMYQIRPVDSITAPGRAAYDFTIWTNPRFPKEDTRCRDVLTVRLTTHGHLRNLGPSEWQLLPTDSPGVHVRFAIDIPDNDTTGFTLEGPCWIGPYTQYFITTGYYLRPGGERQPIEVVDGDIHDPLTPQKSEKWLRDSIGWYGSGGVTVYLTDSLGNEIPVPRAYFDSAGNYVKPAKDTVASEGRLTIVPGPEQESAAERRSRLERSPLQGQQFQYLQVGDTLFMRKEGETKFYPAKPTKRR